jgi:hypothetical protein
MAAFYPERGHDGVSIFPMEEHAMLWTIGVILLLLWLFGFMFSVAGNLIHLLLVIAAIVVVIQLVQGRRVIT